MKKILFSSTLFFNKIGNQSLLETIKEYSKYYEVHFITSSSDRNDYYLSFEEARSKLPSNVHLYRTPQLFHTFFRGLSFLVKKLVRPKNQEISSSDELVNLRYSYLNILSFKLATLTTCIYAFYLKFFKHFKEVDVICAYEIGGVEDALFIRNRLFPQACLIAKMQGTVLMPILEKREISDAFRRTYILDVKAYQRLKEFDLVTMTNDGTRGDEVLEFFGVPKRNIVFLMNGVSENILKSRENEHPGVERSNGKIKIGSISRLVGWKRVHLSIELINKLVNEYSFRDIELEVYGKGTEGELVFINSLVSNYGLSDYVAIKGEVKHELVPQLMKSKDFIISLYKYTNVTNPLLEAVYLGTPVITLKDRSLDKILQHDPKKNIYIFDEGGSESELINDIANFIRNLDINVIRDRRNMLRDWKPSSILSWKERVRIENERIKGVC